MASRLGGFGRFQEPLKRVARMDPGRQLGSSRNVKYQPSGYGPLTAFRYPEPGQCMVGSLKKSKILSSTTQTKKNFIHQLT
jgi:hypothetical protein